MILARYTGSVKLCGQAARLESSRFAGGNTNSHPFDMVRKTLRGFDANPPEPTRKK